MVNLAKKVEQFFFCRGGWGECHNIRHNSVVPSLLITSTLFQLDEQIRVDARFGRILPFWIE